MKVSLKGMLATAAGAALFASAGIALADGMPGGGSYARPALWSGAYVGFESGWEWDHTKFDLVPGLVFPTLNPTSNRDVISAGLFVGYQHQFGNLVLGVELNLIGNEFDNHKDANPVPIGSGNCIFGLVNCVGRITNEITIGPRLGYAVGNFLPYVTGGFATGSVNFREVFPGGVAAAWGDTRANGWFAGGGLDWKLARNVVVGVEYRHTDLGSTDMTIFNTSGAPGSAIIRAQAESDAVLLRGSLLFGGRDYAPLK
jgi:outer membrane immunogenic protein